MSPHTPRVNNGCTKPDEAARFARFQLEELVTPLDDLDELTRVMICDLIGGLRCLGLPDRVISWQLRYADAQSVQGIIDDGLREDDYGELRLDSLVFFQLDRVVQYLETIGKRRTTLVCSFALRILQKTPPGLRVQ